MIIYDYHDYYNYSIIWCELPRRGEEPFIEERRSNNKILDGGETQQDILDLLQLNTFLC